MTRVVSPRGAFPDSHPQHLGMPGMHGDELAQNIWQLAPTQRVLIMTAYFEKLLAAGKPADAMLAKPLSVDELRRAVALATE